MIINFGETALLFEDEEAHIPFRQSDLPFLVNKIKLAHKRCDGDGYVTLRALRTELNVISWDDLKENDSSLAEALLSPAFKNESLN